jgi:hypothetical protein
MNLVGGVWPQDMMRRQENSECCQEAQPAQPGAQAIAFNFQRSGLFFRGCQSERPEHGAASDEQADLQILYILGVEDNTEDRTSRTALPSVGPSTPSRRASSR